MMEVQFHDENALAVAPQKRLKHHPSQNQARNQSRVALGTVTNTARHAKSVSVETSTKWTNALAATHHRSTTSLPIYEPASDETEIEEVHDDDIESHDGLTIDDEEMAIDSHKPAAHVATDDDDNFDVGVELHVDADAAVVSPPLSPTQVDKLNEDALFPQLDPDSQHTLALLTKKYANMPGVFDEHDEDFYDMSMVAEYADDIFEYTRVVENEMRPDPNYMVNQKEIHWPMRSILIDWLVQVHHRFGLLPETLYLTINYIDRFLSLKVVSITKFQLVGAVALFLAAKYEEINCPSVKDIAYMVDHGYTDEEILRAEWYMIDLLEFNLAWPGPMSFLRRTSKADDYDLETRTLSKYLLETTIMERKFVGAPPSWLAAASHCLSRQMLQRGEWTESHTYFSGYTAKQLEPAIRTLLDGLGDPTNHHKAIYDKYADRKFKRASVFVRNWMEKGN